MNFEPFLDAKAIIALQEAEMASDKVQKGQLNKLKRFIVMVKIF